MKETSRQAMLNGPERRSSSAKAPKDKAENMDRPLKGTSLAILSPSGVTDGGADGTRTPMKKEECCASSHSKRKIASSSPELKSHRDKRY